VLAARLILLKAALFINIIIIIIIIIIIMQNFTTIGCTAVEITVGGPKKISQT